MHVLAQIGLVALGSAIGGLTRFGVNLGSYHLFGAHFPWATFLINISGSLFLGWFMTVTGRQAEGAWGLSAEHLKLLIAVGFTGAYTTFSTFEYESARLLEEGENLKSLLYVAGSVFLGLAAVKFGMYLGRGVGPR